MNANPIHHDDTDDDEFGGFNEQEVDRRGRLEPHISHADVVRTSNRVLKSGILTLLEDWDEIDNPVPGRGGRPAIINRHAILVGLLLLAAERNSLWVRNLNRLFYRRLTPESREYLGLPTPIASFGLATQEELRWEKNVGNAFHRILRLMDPYPMKRYTNLAFAQIRDVRDAHDKEREQVARLRLNQFTNALILMTFHEQPRRIRRISKQLDISFDQTAIRSPTLAKQYAPKGLDAKVAEEKAVVESGDIERIIAFSKTSTVDPFAGYHAKAEPARSDLRPGTRDTTSPTRGSKKVDYAWGWEVNIAVRVDSEFPTGNRFPQIATAATLSMPNVGVSEEAVELMRYSLATGLKPGLGDADKQYWANALPERLHTPARALGWTPSTDYRIDRLGPPGKKGELGSKDGVEFIEGMRFCPGTPPNLKMASVDHEKKQNGVDDAVYKTRIGERRAFQVHAKERPDANGRQPVSCPARGNSPTVTCPIFELLMEREGKTLPTVTHKKDRPRVENEDAPNFDTLPKICKQHSVTLRQEDDTRTSQGFQYKSEEWQVFHNHARNSIEGLNGNGKNQGQESIDEIARRRVRGFAAAAVFMAVLLTTYNLRTIATFLKEEAIAAQKNQPANPTSKKPIRRRDRVAVNSYTGTLPSEPILLAYYQDELASPLRT